LIDSLTNIPSYKVLEETIKKTKHPKLFLIDLKNFGQLNLTYSDEAGDYILKEFASSLKEFAQDNEMSAFRVKEDEFALIKDMPFDLTSMEKLIFLLEGFLKDKNYYFNEQKITVNAHIGICLDQNNLFEKAQKALKIAQREDQPFMTYSDFVNMLLEEDEERICTLLRESIEDGTITPYFQRIIDLEDNVIYQEVLIRIVSKNGTISPKIFLNIAKQKGFYLEMVKLIIEKISNINDVKALNISCSELFDEELFSLYKSNFENNNTIFELQNEKCLNDITVPKKIKDLKSKNIQICLDNVDNTTYVKNLDVDFVKVKGNLIRLLKVDDKAVSTCKEIISTCKEKNIKIIATHINSNSSFEEAKKLGFDYYQGFFFGEPTSKLN